VDDRRIVSAIVFVIRNGLRWRDAPWEYGPHNTIMIDAAHLKAHRTAASLLEKGLFPDVSDPRKGLELQTSMRFATAKVDRS